MKIITLDQPGLGLSENQNARTRAKSGTNSYGYRSTSKESPTASMTFLPGNNQEAQDLSRLTTYQSIWGRFKLNTFTTEEKCENPNRTPNVINELEAQIQTDSVNIQEDMKAIRIRYESLSGFNELR